MATFTNSPLPPDTDSGKYAPGEAYAKAKLQIAKAILPRIVFLMHFIKITKLCLTIAPCGSNKVSNRGGFVTSYGCSYSCLFRSLMRKHRSRSRCVRAASVTHV